MPVVLKPPFLVDSLLMTAGEALRMVPCVAPLSMALEPRATTLDNIVEVDEGDDKR